MLTIYGCLRSRASRNVWMAHEAGLDFRHVPVIQAYRLPNPDAADAPLHTRSPAFLAVNPNGHIPSLTDGALVLHESLAINLYLARRHGGALGPADAAEDGLMTMWSFWGMTEVEAHSLEILFNRGGRPAAVAALRGPVAVLDKALAATGFLVGGRFTVADLNVAEVIRYALSATELFAEAPHLRAWIAACHDRPAYRRMMAERDQEPA